MNVDRDRLVEDALAAVSIPSFTGEEEAMARWMAERQRVQLTRAVRNETTGVLYVLDEPSIGLHTRDNQRLIEILRQLRDQGREILGDAEFVLRRLRHQDLRHAFHLRGRRGDGFPLRLAAGGGGLDDLAEARLERCQRALHVDAEDPRGHLTTAAGHRVRPQRVRQVAGQRDQFPVQQVRPAVGRELPGELLRCKPPRVADDIRPARGQPVGRHVDDALSNLLRLIRPRRERVLVGDEEVAVVLGLEADAVLERAHIMPEVQPPGGRVAGEDARTRGVSGHRGQV